MIKPAFLAVSVFVCLTTGCRTGEPRVPPENVSQAQNGSRPGTSKEWLIGRWEWRSKSRTDTSDLLLECLAEFRVYPYMDFDAASVRMGEAYIPAEFITRDCNGREELLPWALPVLMKPDSFFAGATSGWSFSYRHWETNGTHWLSMKLVPDKGGWSFSIVFEKESDDPGQPFDRAKLLAVFPYSDDPEKWDSDYRRRKGLK